MRGLLATIAVLGLVAAPAAHASFPGANGKIAFTSNEDPFVVHSLLTIEPDGSERTKIVAGGDDPSWSPDGTRIAYLAEFHARAEIAIVNGDGSGQVTVTSTPASKGHPAWSPDGSRIAFTQHVPDPGPFGAFEIFAMNADGTGQTRITDSRAAGALHSGEPAWSPDGRKLAFIRTIVHDGSPGSDSEIYVMNVDGTGVMRLTHNPSGIDVGPSWSPDGSLILFESERDGEYGVYVMNPDGTGVRRVPAPPLARHSTWSPDGSRIAFANSFHDLFTVRLDGSGLVRLTDTPGISELNPDWQPVNRDPDCSRVTASPDSLWPPNNKLVTVTLGGATDPDGNTVVLAVTGVTGDESITGDFALGPASHEVRLRAERDGSGDGRTYTVSFEATDGRGGSCAGVVTVRVPKSMARSDP